MCLVNNHCNHISFSSLVRLGFRKIISDTSKVNGVMCTEFGQQPEAQKHSVLFLFAQQNPAFQLNPACRNRRPPSLACILPEQAILPLFLSAALMCLFGLLKVYRNRSGFSADQIQLHEPKLNLRATHFAEHLQIQSPVSGTRALHRRSQPRVGAGGKTQLGLIHFRPSRHLRCLLLETGE